MGKITDMQAYHMQKIAMQRRKAYQDRLAYEEQRRQQRELEAARERRALREQRETAIRQTNVKNIVGGRKLTPAYEVSVPAGGAARGYDRKNDGYRERRTAPRTRTYGSDPYRRTYERNQPRSTTRPVRDMGYAAPRRAPVHGFDMVEAAAGSRTATYGGMKPIAVEYENPRKKGLVSTFILILVVFAMLAGVVIRYAQISNLNLQNAQIESRITELTQDLDKVKVNRALSEDLSTLRQSAAALGMAEPKDGQLVYLQPGELDAADEAVQADQAMQPADTGDTITVEGQTSGETAQGVAANAAEEDLDGIAGFFQTIWNTIKGWFPN